MNSTSRDPLGSSVPSENTCKSQDRFCTAKTALIHQEHGTNPRARVSTSSRGRPQKPNTEEARRTLRSINSSVVDVPICPNDTNFGRGLHV